MAISTVSKAISINAPAASMGADLTVPPGATTVVVFAHGSGSSRHSPRNQHVATTLVAAGFGTLLLDLLTPQEEAVDSGTAALRFNIPFLAGRLEAATEWLVDQPEAGRAHVGYFGASTGAAAALLAAAQSPDNVGAIVSRGGRPDSAGGALPAVRAPTLLIVGSDDPEVLALNEAAKAKMRAPCELEVVPGATHLFEEPGALDHVANLAADWFTRWL